MRGAHYIGSNVGGGEGTYHNIWDARGVGVEHFQGAQCTDVGKIEVSMSANSAPRGKHCKHQGIAGVPLGEGSGGGAGPWAMGKYHTFAPRGPMQLSVSANFVETHPNCFFALHRFSMSGPGYCLYLGNPGGNPTALVRRVTMS